ncbi:MAG TPA: pyridoxal-dependent decarboxylase, partial [Methylophilaceae bacterium]|nr:pyridoxal-dependent decarboxylase [Methylophilaceae bacterium]
MNEDRIKALIAAMFDPENFRAHGHALIELLADQLAKQLAGDGKVLDWREPTHEDLRWRQPLPQKPSFEAAGLLARLK